MGDTYTDKFRKTCLECRTKKVRCDGNTPICGRCAKSTRGASVCEYEVRNSRTARPAVSSLQKGNACLPCRRKKKRCDALRPCCTTCRTAGKEANCEYNEEQTMAFTLLERTHALEERLASYETSDRPALHDLSTSLQNDDSIQPTFTSALIDIPTFISSSDMSIEPSIEPSIALPNQYSLGNEPSQRHISIASKVSASFLDFATASYSCSTPSSGSASTSQDPSVCSPSTCTSSPEAPNDNFGVNTADMVVPMLNGAEGSLEISENAHLLDQVEEFRRAFVAHRAQYCFNMTGLRTYAVMQGDPTGVLVDHSLLHAVTLLGFALWQAEHNTSAPDIESLFLKRVEDSLRLRGSVIPATLHEQTQLLETYTCMGIYHLFRQYYAQGRTYFEQAGNVVKMMDIDAMIGSISKYKFPEQHLEATIYTDARHPMEESLGAVFQFLFFDRAATVALDCTPQFEEDFDRPFEALRTLCPTVWQSNLVFVRSRAISLLARARRISAVWKTSAADTASEELAKSYWALSSEVTEHVGLLTTSMLRATFALDGELGITLKCSLATVLTAKALLHSLLSCHPESMRMSLRDVGEVASVLSGIHERDFKYMDAVLGACMTFCFDIILKERKRSILSSNSQSQNDQIIQELHKCFQGLELVLPWVSFARLLAEEKCTDCIVELDGSGLTF